MSTEKVLHLKAMGAEVHITRSDVAGQGAPEYYQDVAARLAKELPRRIFADQPGQPTGPQCSTAPEIWAQTEHDLTGRRRLGRHPGSG